MRVTFPGDRGLEPTIDPRRWLPNDSDRDHCCSSKTTPDFAASCGGLSDSRRRDRKRPRERPLLPREQQPQVVVLDLGLPPTRRGRRGPGDARSDSGRVPESRFLMTGNRIRAMSRAVALGVRLLAKSQSTWKS